MITLDIAKRNPAYHDADNAALEKIGAALETYNTTPQTPSHFADTIIDLAHTPAGLAAIAIAMLRGAGATDEQITAKAAEWTAAAIEDAF